jgi:diguanylate cyclase (GGDEF)-like protein
MPVWWGPLVVGGLVLANRRFTTAFGDYSVGADTLIVVSMCAFGLVPWLIVALLAVDLVVWARQCEPAPTWRESAWTAAHGPIVCVATFLVLLEMRGVAPAWLAALVASGVPFPSSVLLQRCARRLRGSPSPTSCLHEMFGEYRTDDLLILPLTALAAVVVSVDPLAVVLLAGPYIALNHSRAARTDLGAAEQASRTDPVTGIGNRRALDAALDRLDRGPAADVTLIMVDVDHFKALNDLYGHEQGDAALSAVGRAILGAIRSQDACARYGGEEFTAILVGLPEREAEAVAGRIKAAGDHALRPWNTTVSAGVAHGGPAPSRVRDVLRRADEALYAAKRAGRNRLATA